jgi:SAM-dependent methyltransferase
MPRGATFTPSGTLRSLAYRFLWRVADACQSAASGCLYLAGGLLRRNDLETASRAYWQHFATSDDAVDAGLEVWERRLYGELLRPGDRILLVGCGAGRDLLALREQGYDVTGLDHAPEIIELARRHLERRGMTAPLVCGFLEDARVEDTYDVIVFSGWCYSYVLGRDRRVAGLRYFKSRLAANGRIVITHTAAGRRSRWIPRLLRFSNVVGRSDWRAQRGDSFIRGFLAPDVLKYEHVFGPGEVVEECALAGLEALRDEQIGHARCVVAVVADVATEAANGRR